GGDAHVRRAGESAILAGYTVQRASSIRAARGRGDSPGRSGIGPPTRIANPSAWGFTREARAGSVLASSVWTSGSSDGAPPDLLSLGRHGSAVQRRVRRGTDRNVSADPLATVRRQVREQLRQRVDARGLASAPRTERRVRVREEALDLLRASGAILPHRELTRMVNEMSDEVVGFGPIEFLLKDPEVTEVMVNG